jgi:UDP-glucose 4-epimerase
MKKILITGSSGYIGQSLSVILKEEGHIIHGLDRFKQPRYCDKFFMEDIDSMNCLKEDYDVVVHLAALVNVGDSVKWPMRYYQTNVGGTLNVLERIQYEHFVFASTGAAEKPASPYALSKRQVEPLVRSYCDFNNKRSTVFRFYNVVGNGVIPPTNQDGLMYNLMKAKGTGEFNVFGADYNTVDGTAIRDYIHVYDVCGAIRTCIKRPYADSLIENLGTGVGTTVYQMVAAFEEANDCAIQVNVLPRREGDLESSVLKDVSPYFRNSYSLKDMLKV